jgi:hypothetical protein
MKSDENNSTWNGLHVGQFENDDIDKLIPLMSQEFKDWDTNQIKSYLTLATSKKNDFAGALIAKNEAGYYVGILIYTLQQIDSKYIESSKSKKNDIGVDVFVVEHLIASSLILQKHVFMSLVDSAMKIAEKYSCNFVELPKFDSKHYELIQEKYKNQISDSKDYRTYLKLNKRTDKQVAL